MASRTMALASRVFEKEAKSIRLTFYPQGSGTTAPTVNANESRGVASVAQTATGLYTITLEDQYLRLVNKQISIQLSAANVDLTAQFGDIDLTAKTVKVRLMAAGTPTAMSADANNSVSVQLDFADSDAY